MLRSYDGRFGWVLLLVLGMCTVTAQADQSRHDSHDQSRHESHNQSRHDSLDLFRYRYASLDQYVPEGYTFFPVSIDDKGRVYGTAYSASAGDVFLGHIAILDHKALTIIQHGMEVWANAANDRGTLGGYALVDPETFLTQAALFHGDQMELIPQQPGVTSSEVLSLNDRDVALVSYYDEADVNKFFLYHEGVSTPLDFGPNDVYSYIGGGNFGGVGFNPSIALELNNQGKIAGTLGIKNIGARAFRFDTSTGETEQFNPLPSDTSAWSQGINKRGDVLGYSFISAGKEHIGVWDRKGKFETYFTEGVPDFPTVSNHLLFNDKNLIVITEISSPVEELGDSYLVPRPGIRLNLACFVDNLPSSQKLTFIQDINSEGSMLGTSPNNFLLERIKSRDHKSRDRNSEDC